MKKKKTSKEEDDELVVLTIAILCHMSKFNIKKIVIKIKVILVTTTSPNLIRYLRICVQFS